MVSGGQRDHLLARQLPEAEITTPDLEYRSGMELAYKCLRNDKITGIVAINDMVAYGVLDALVREGYRVPEDFSLCGFDNVTSSGYQRIQLTTVDNNTFSHGKSAFNLLLERIEDGLNSREDQPINRVEYRNGSSCAAAPASRAAGL